MVHKVLPTIRSSVCWAAAGFVLEDIFDPFHEYRNNAHARLLQQAEAPVAGCDQLLLFLLNSRK